jgi:GWxTD domain-containing protein
LARALIEREAGVADSALVASNRFLALGGDSGVGLLEKARTLFELGRVEEGSEAYFAGAAAAKSLRAVVGYRADLTWIATREELAEFDSTTALTRGEWLEDCWARRAARDGRRPGERLSEHYRRIRYAMRNFRRAFEPRQGGASQQGNAPLGRLRSQSGQRIVRLDGSETDESAGSREVGRTAGELWGALSGSGPGDLSPAEVYARTTDQTMLRAFHSNQAAVDDRGAIYVRHGEPDERATYVGPEADANESWKYYTPEGPLIFHFFGTVAPANLVEQLPLFAPMLASRAGLNARYERMAFDLTRPHNLTLKPEEIAAERARNRLAIALGTSTDDYVLKFDQRLDAVVQPVGVRQGLGGGGMILVVFAVPAARLSVVRTGPDSVIAYPVRLRVIAEERTTHRLTQLDTTRVFATHRILAKDEFVTGQLRVPVPAGSYIIRTVLTDMLRRSGDAVGADSVPVPDLEAQKLEMSDLVLGRQGSGQQWIAAEDTVPLNPLNAFSRRSEAEVYYQLGGLRPGSVYKTRIEVKERVAGTGHRAVLQFDHAASRPREAVRRTIALDRLSPGEYVITISVSGPDGAAVERKQFLTVTD